MHQNLILVDKRQHFSLPVPHIFFDIIQIMFISSQVGSRWFTRADATSGMFSKSPFSSGRDSGRALVPLLSIPPLVSQADRGLREYCSRIITRHWLYESMETCCKHYSLQHTSQAVCSQLPITHCWAHTICKDVGGASFTHGNVVTGEKTYKRNVTITAVFDTNK